MFSALSNLQRYLKDAINTNHTPGQFSFIGDFLNFSNKIDSLTAHERQTMTKAFIIITGSIAKDGSECCIMATCVAGCLLCLPFLLLGCQCYRRILYPSYEIPLRIYQKLQSIIEAPNMNSLELIVQDNTLGAQKAHVLHSFFKKSHIKVFNFQNNTQQFSYGDQNCYDNFDDNFQPIKNIAQIRSRIRWDPKGAISQ